MQIILLKPEDLPHFAGLYFDGAFPCDERELILGAVDETCQTPLGVGLLAVRSQDDALVMDWLFVAPEHRKQGVGTALLERLRNAARQDPDIGSIVAFAAQSQGIMEFLDRLGFAVFLQENQGCYRGTLGGLRELQVADLPPERILPLREVPDFMLRALNMLLAQDKIQNCGVPLPIQPEDYAPQSTVTWSGDDITSLVLLEEKNGELHIDWAFSMPRCQRDFAGLLKAVSERLREEFSPETPLVMGTLGPAGDRLVRSLLPEAEWEPLYAAILTWEEGSYEL